MDAQTCVGDQLHHACGQPGGGSEGVKKVGRRGGRGAVKGFRQIRKGFGMSASGHAHTVSISRSGATATSPVAVHER
eukprot:5443848-Pyramimonas_sp.AAC.2